MKKRAEQELRKHPRVDVHIPAEYHILGPEDRNAGKGFFETENISVGGLMFYSYVRLRKDENLLIQLYIDKQLVEFSARVVWTAEWSDSKDPIKSYAIGLQYFEISRKAVELINQAASRIVLLKPGPAKKSSA